MVVQVDETIKIFCGQVDPVRRQKCGTSKKIDHSASVETELVHLFEWVYTGINWRNDDTIQQLYAELAITV
jgi:hypothetical protein